MIDHARQRGLIMPLGLLLIFVTSRLTLIAVALVVEATTPMQPGGSASTAPILRSLTASDGVWYVGIAANGYHAQPLRGPFHDYVFFPAFPILVRAIGAMVGGDLPTAAVLAANITYAIALVLFAQISRPILGSSGALVAAAFLSFAPGAVAFGMAYSDSLFLAVALGAVLAAIRGKYATASVLLVVASLTRFPGVVVAIPLAVLIGERDGWSRHRRWLWLAPGPIALVAFLGLVAALSGDPLGWFHAQAAWNSPPDTAAPPGLPSIPPFVILLALVVVVCAELFQLVYLRFSGIGRANAAYLVAGLVALGLAARIVSLPRYLAVLWPLPLLFTARRSQLFVRTALICSVFAFVCFAWLDFTTLVAA